MMIDSETEFEGETNRIHSAGTDEKHMNVMEKMVIFSPVFIFK